MRRWFRAPLLSPTWLATRAGLLLVCYTVVAMLGWREFTTVLSGTSVSGDYAADMVRAGVYLCFYFLATLVAPVFLIAAVIEWLREAL